MRFRLLLFISFYFPGLFLTGFTQTLPLERSVDWTLAGLRDTTSNNFQKIDMQAFGAVGDGLTPNDIIMSSVLSSNLGSGAILEFPTGNFLFNYTIDLPSNIIIRGQGAESTILTMNLNGFGHAINVQGISIGSDTTSLVQTAIKDSSFIIVLSPNNFTAGNWIQIIQQDTNLVSSDWAENTVGQIVKIENIVNNKIILSSPIRMDIDITASPYIYKINPVQNVGIECLKIQRIDDTSPEHSSNIHFKNAVNCWVLGIESQNCTYSHIEAESCSNLFVSKSYIHHAFDYGEGGRAYGVMLHYTTNECLIENNIFEHLRHSMILQAGANGNVFAYNYSKDPFWTVSPSNSSGDMVLHGNYTYSNLFEQNICQNIVIDNSHGPNGPYNTFLRNRSESFGIFFSENNSPNQNFLGNDIPNTNWPYSIVNYTIRGTGHFIYGNNNKGVIDPPGTNALPDLSYAYTERPDFVPVEQWASIGTPNIIGTASIPARDRYNSGEIFSNACVYPATDIEENHEPGGDILIFPNPIKSYLSIKCNIYITNLTIINELGQVIPSHKDAGLFYQIDTKDWLTGTYIILIKLANNKSILKKTVKVE